MNKAEHDLFGGILGGVTALVTALVDDRPPSLGEVVGGVLGGTLGSKLPDAIEPATSPNHRKAAHSVVALGTSVYTATQASRWQNQVARAAASEQDAFLRFIAQALGGMATGVPSGYASHLALDATTPKGIPLLGL